MESINAFLRFCWLPGGEISDFCWDWVNCDYVLLHQSLSPGYHGPEQAWLRSCNSETTSFYTEHFRKIQHESRLGKFIKIIMPAGRYSTFIPQEWIECLDTVYEVGVKSLVFTYSDFSYHDCDSESPARAWAGASSKKYHKTQHEEIVCLSWIGKSQPSTSSSPLRASDCWLHILPN